MRKFVILSVVLNLVAYAGYGQIQQAEKLRFIETVFDFGTVKEADGPITHEFKFINNSSEPIKISNVKASCGCTTPAWTKEAVNPGETGLIQAQYNPKNRPGTFNKSLTISSESFDAPMKLYIKGNVVPKANSVSDELPAEMGSIRLKYRSLNMGKIQTKDEPSIKEFEVYNDSEEQVTFEDSVVSAKHIRMEFEPKSLKANERGLIRIVYDAKSRNDLGFMNDNVLFFTDEKGDAKRKSISVYATVEEYFPPMTVEQLAKAPKIVITEAVHDLGRIKQNAKVSTEFIVKNEGKTPLIIRKTRANCSCMAPVMDSTTIKPGNTAKLKVTFDAYNRRGNQQKSVTIYSNDPKASAQRVTIKAYVTQEKAEVRLNDNL